VQLLLGRVAEGSILILEGDYRQMDAKAFEQDNGMLAAVNHLKGNRLFSYIHLNESVRSETAKLADLLDERT
jgi:predicted ribonuclease YlaK